MKVVILAGGFGTRLAEETVIKPKPMVEIGGKPILWHIMKIYSHYGFNEFVIALGYKGEYIKEYFLNYSYINSDFMVDLATGEVSKKNNGAENWKVHLIDTGLNTATGGRIKRLKHLLSEGTFMLTYGDGVARIDLEKLLEFHKSHGKLATLTAVRPPARYGSLRLDGQKILNFSEKLPSSEGFVNGGFFVLEPKVLDYISGDNSEWEGEALANLAKERQLMAFPHQDFWQSMDTVRDVKYLNSLWESGEAAWMR